MLSGGQRIPPSPGRSRGRLCLLADELAGFAPVVDRLLEVVRKAAAGDGVITRRAARPHKALRSPTAFIQRHGENRLSGKAEEIRDRIDDVELYFRRR
jgi:hypothetical protein